MYKLVTALDNFKFDSSEQVTPKVVDWYILERDVDDDENGRPFTMEELNIFLNFVENNKQNFPGVTNYHAVNNEDAPYLDLYDELPTNKRPHYIIIRSSPENYAGDVKGVIDILLLPKHTYNLSFNVIGVFQ